MKSSKDSLQILQTVGEQDNILVKLHACAKWDNVCVFLFAFLQIIAYKAVPHVINSRTLKPCINEATHALLMHGYATFNMLVPEP